MTVLLWAAMLPPLNLLDTDPSDSFQLTNPATGSSPMTRIRSLRLHAGVHVAADLAEPGIDSRYVCGRRVESATGFEQQCARLGNGTVNTGPAIANQHENCHHQRCAHNTASLGWSL